MQLKEVVETCNHWQEVAEKANEWHYPSKGEYPKDEGVVGVINRYYCLFLGDGDHIMGKYIRGSFWSAKGWCSIDEVIAWKEIVPPELKESE